MSRPDVVFIITDNQADWTLGCYGNEEIRTPHVDAMAREETVRVPLIRRHPEPQFDLWRGGRSKAGRLQGVWPEGNRCSRGA